MTPNWNIEILAAQGGYEPKSGAACIARALYVSMN